MEMRLLIAEDEADLAEALTVFFEKNHFSVDAVGDGFSAYEYASAGDYDGILLDVMMPKMNGVEVLKKLREEGIRTPVMMLTAKQPPATGSPALTPAPTTTFRSPLSPMNSSAGFVPCSAAAETISRTS